MRSILESLLIFLLVLVMLFATACGQAANSSDHPEVSVPDVSEGSTTEEQITITTESVTDITDDTTTNTEESSATDADATTTTAANTTTATSTAVTTVGTSGTTATAGTTADATTTTTKKTEASTTTSTTTTQKSITQKTTSATTAATTAKTTTGVTTTVTTRTTASVTTTQSTTTSTTTTTKRTTTTTCPTDAPDAHPGKEWTLIWSDEFNGTEIDTNAWYVEFGEKGNTKLKKENVEVKDGNCLLTVQREQVGEFEFTGASLHTWRNFNFQYGRLEFRAKLPYGQGVFPALWTMGDSYWLSSNTQAWPACGEIDVMEMIGSGNEEEKYNLMPNQQVSGTVHWGADRNHHYSNGFKYTIRNGFPSDYYHIYAVEWDEERIVWYVDDTQYHCVYLNEDMGNSFHQPHWIIMNIVMNGLGAVSPLPQSMYVDYVRVYQKK